MPFSGGVFLLAVAFVGLLLLRVVFLMMLRRDEVSKQRNAGEGIGAEVVYWTRESDDTRATSSGGS
ncbi:MAG: hypothetical protein KF757_12560 [Phycisphaeraceae bacterium]|nr:hypothetical protein [Phycisphaeraceae bacterium]MCW5762547.1 hypothetical protein [Phycisphaeraceae bacterium]